MINKKQMLKNWLNGRKYVKTHEIMQFGLSIYSNGADRYKRKLVEEGFLKPLSKAEKLLTGFNSKEGVYQVMGEN